MNDGSSEPIIVTHIISGDLWAGAEVQVYNLCKGLLASGEVRPTAVVFNEGILSARLRELGMEVDVASEQQLSAIKIIYAIKNHCLKHQSKVVHTHGFKENILGILGKDLARVPRSVRTVHGNPETRFSLFQLDKRLVQYLDIMLGRLRQSHVIAVSTQLEARLNELFPGKVRKIFNFIDVDSLRHSRPKTANPGHAQIKLGIIGRLVPVKRVDIFLETIALLRNQNINCSGIVIGTGPLEQQLKDYVTKLGIDQFIEFRGFIDPVQDELCQLDLLIMTSDHEGLPMTLLEALALEVPIVAHETGGIPEILKNGECGWLATGHSARGYSEATRDAISSEMLRSKKAAVGLEHVRSYFGMDQNVAAYLNIYKSAP